MGEAGTLWALEYILFPDIRDKFHALDVSGSFYGFRDGSNGFRAT